MNRAAAERNTTARCHRSVDSTEHVRRRTPRTSLRHSLHRLLRGAHTSARTVLLSARYSRVHRSTTARRTSRANVAARDVGAKRLRRADCSDAHAPSRNAARDTPRLWAHRAKCRSELSRRATRGRHRLLPGRASAATCEVYPLSIYTAQRSTTRARGHLAHCKTSSAPGGQQPRSARSRKT